ncbi:hypothetical protein NLJ89_g5735 [Agrocybe chaxingu]|uniref:DUF6534 domain-containing protein n=1 Tax=Agrocybe chaxingu TaxID=84603 RepID=A0A9W8MTC7_9AGAR|nr:hypothetical protein NLJ89_g5735 [Agrocybe chaxingu]
MPSRRFINRYVPTPHISRVIPTPFVREGGAIWSTVQVTDFRLTSKKPETHPPVLLCLASALSFMYVRKLMNRFQYARRTGLKAADEVISRIIVFTIQTGLVTSIGAILDLILLITVPEININFIFDVTLVKIYAISLLSTLNARASLNDQLNHRQNLLFEGRPSDTNWV